MGGHKFLSPVLGLSQKPRGTWSPPAATIAPLRTQVNLQSETDPGAFPSSKWGQEPKGQSSGRRRRSWDWRARTRSSPGLAGRRRERVRNEHPTVRRRRLLLLFGAPEVEGGMLLRGPALAGLPGFALGWRGQRHRLVLLQLRLPGRDPLCRPGPVEEHTWAPAPQTFPARRGTPPPRRGCGERQRVAELAPRAARAALQPELLGRGGGTQPRESAPSLRGWQGARVQVRRASREPQVRQTRPGSPPPGARRPRDSDTYWMLWAPRLPTLHPRL